MKKFLIIISLLIIASNTSTGQTKYYEVNDTNQILSTIVWLDSLDKNVNFYKKQCDSLRHVIAITNFQIRREIGYINIVINNPSQVKFLSSWSLRDGIFLNPVYKRMLIANKKKK